jgi:hypothetical protein
MLCAAAPESPLTALESPLTLVFLVFLTCLAMRDESWHA